MSQSTKTASKAINPNAETRDISKFKAITGNIYESIAIIAKRANQINLETKQELHSKLEEFATHTDNLEEVHENKEQIEISKHYERQPNPAILASEEFLNDKIYFRNKEDDEQQYS